jgi:hypothetical protein
MISSTAYRMRSPDTPEFSSIEEVRLALQKLAELVKLKQTDPEAYDKELDRMFPGSTTRDPQR